MKKKKNNEMKENSFIQGAFIATFGIVISKILGIIYVIPFYALIGPQGGALYGYAYNIYSIFLSISQAGIPLAMSKIISEYLTLGYYNAKERAYKIGLRLLNILGVLSFLILMIFADQIAKLIIGNVTGGNTIADVAFTIRVISTAILVVPILSVSRGYLQGHKFISPTSASQVLEQIVRVVIIVGGSFIFLRLLKQSLTVTVGVSLFAATIGSLFSYLYLARIMKNNREKQDKQILVVDEPKITNKEILNKLIIYALPFVLIDISKTLFNSVDIVTLVKVLVNNYSYQVTYAESILSVISTWGTKINMIVMAVNTGILVSLVPHLTSSLTNKDTTGVNRRINQSLQAIIFFVIPMVVGLSLLAKPVWTVFYGHQSAIDYGTLAYQYFVFVALASALYTTTITIIQVLKEYKMTILLLVLSILIKIIFNVPLIDSFSKLGLPVFYGAFTATILGNIIPTVIGLVFLNKKFKINYEKTLKVLVNVINAVLLMAITLIITNNVLNLSSSSRIINIFIIILNLLIGSGMYFGLLYKNKTISDVFGEKNIEKIKNKFIRRRVK